MTTLDHLSSTTNSTNNENFTPSLHPLADSTNKEFKFNPLGLDIKLPNWKRLLQRLDTVYYHCKLPLLGNVPVSLSDVINVLNRSLTESEVWTVLSTAAEALEDFLISAIQYPDNNIDISLDSILLTSTGKITFKEKLYFSENSRRKSKVSSLINKSLARQSSEESDLSKDSQCSDPPNNKSLDVDDCRLTTRRQSITWAVTVPRRYSLQMEQSNVNDYLSGELLPYDLLEMTHVETLGQALRLATEFHEKDFNNRSNKIGTLLNAVLTAMMEPNINFRMRLSDIIRICSVHVAKYTNGDQASKYVKRLHAMVMEKIPEEEILQEIQQRIRLEEEYSQLALEIQRVRCDESTGTCSCSDSRSVNEEYASMSYGRRLDFHPERRNSLAATVCRICQTFTSAKMSLRSLWYWAFLKISADFKMKQIAVCKTMGQLADHPAKHAVGNIYNQLLERRIVLQGLRTGNFECSNPKKNISVKSKGQKRLFHSLPSLVLLLQERPAFMQSSSESNSRNSSINSKRILQRKSLGKSLMRFHKQENHQIMIDFKNKNAKEILVVLPDQMVIRFICNPATTLCKTLLQQLCSRLEIQESHFFQLAYFEDNEYVFLSNMSRVCGVPTENKKNSFFRLYFRIKYFARSVVELRHELTRHIFVLQLWSDLLNWKLFCAEQLWKKVNEITSAEDMVSIRDFIKMEKDEHMLENLKSISNRNKLLLAEFLDFEFYGLHFHKLQQSRRNIHSIVWLAVGLESVCVFEQSTSSLIITQNYRWKDVEKISFKKHQFELVPKACNKSGSRVTYKFFSPDLNKYAKLIQSSSMILERFEHLCKSYSEISSVRLMQSLNVNFGIYCKKDLS